MEGQRQEMQEGRGAGDAPQLNFMISKNFNRVILMLLTVIQLNCEGKDKSPFETHPAQMWVFVLSSIIYFSAAQRSVPMANISGSLSLVSLLSVLLPRLLGALIFIPWAFVPLILTYQIHAVSIRDACRRLHDKINTFISTSIEQLRVACRQLHHKINTIISTSVEQQQLPPV